MYMRIHTCVYIHNNIFTKVKDLSMSVVGTVLRCQPAAPTRIYSWDNSRAPALASRVSLWDLGVGLLGAFIIRWSFHAFCTLKRLIGHRIDGFSRRSGTSYPGFPRVLGAGGVIHREDGKRVERGKGPAEQPLGRKARGSLPTLLASHRQGPPTEDLAAGITHWAKPLGWCFPTGYWQRLWCSELKVENESPYILFFSFNRNNTQKIDPLAQIGWM